MSDPNFTRGVVLVLEHDRQGAVGLVLNRPSDSPVYRWLPDWAPWACEPPVVFVGGPCEPEIGVCLMLSPEGRNPIRGLDVVDLSEPPRGPVRIFSGYSGWGPGQLEEEVEEQAWMVVDADPADVSTATPERLWWEVLRRQPGPLRSLATYPDDPRLN